MAELGRGQRPVVMPHYPHMLAEDVAVWTAFLEINPNFLERVWYDVHVGNAMPLPVGASRIESRVALGVSRKRIDVVAKAQNEYFVVEVKPYGNMVALGQAVAYARLFLNEYPSINYAYPTIVCYKADKDLLEEFEAQGISVFETGK